LAGFFSREIMERELHLEQGGNTGKYCERRWRFLATIIGLLLCFGPSLYRLTRFAVESELYSYILLMPFVSLYLVWLKRCSLPVYSEPARRLAAAFVAAGSAVLAIYWLVDRSTARLMIDDRLAFTTFSFILYFLGVCCFFVGRHILGHLVFAMGLLVFIVPLPALLMKGVETFLQYGSALVAEGLFVISGTTFSREGLSFQLPGISVEVAPECSGIHSSLVLFITSLLAGYFFLRSPGKRVALTLAVIPLALLRNGFRIFTIGQLCIHIGPEMINSFIHRKGGPLFFGLSLIPFLLLLYLLQKTERGKSQQRAAGTPHGKVAGDLSGSKG
jgi:exosortase C (VPDSG-CTERM-specific)